LGGKKTGFRKPPDDFRAVIAEADLVPFQKVGIEQGMIGQPERPGHEILVARHPIEPACHLEKVADDLDIRRGDRTCGRIVRGVLENVLGQAAHPFGPGR
jgi:hypothetical protein